jgi:hypothetical protein
MKSAKTVIGLFFAALPILYFGGMAYYLHAVPGRLEAMFGLPGGATDGVSSELGPTILGLGAIVVLFAFFFLLKVVRTASRTSPVAVAGEMADDEPFDADAALARYLARKAAGELDVMPVIETPSASASVRGFGRKGA